ncbi:uncharacterized protein PG986_000136 [Apiospora aurea]|uniref:Uncharacterized protein n=1 Tax=Apiospora aurea TaxID=335848 RepID=A0ABR1QT77_9PEZI
MVLCTENGTEEGSGLCVLVLRQVCMNKKRYSSDGRARDQAHIPAMHLQLCSTRHVEGLYLECAAAQVAMSEPDTLGAC